MGIDNIRPIRRAENLPSSGTEAGAISLEVGHIGSVRKNKEVKIRGADVSQIAKGLAEVAFSIGQTNNPEAFSSELAEDIMEALKKVKKRQEEKRKRQQHHR